MVQGTTPALDFETAVARDIVRGRTNPFVRRLEIVAAARHDSRLMSTVILSCSYDRPFA